MASSPSVLPPPSAAPPGLWRSVRQALAGGQEEDYTALPLNRAVLLLAAPMVMEMVMESLFAISDVFWVSRLGRNAIAVVGLTESVMTLIYSVAIGISFAATAIVARRIGEKNPRAAARAAGQVLMLGLTASAALGVVMGLLAPHVLHAMGADDAIVATGTPFTRLMLGGNMTVFMIFILNAVFRGAGDAVIAMRTLILANALNILLDPCFIYGLGPCPHLGVTGAAVATNTGRGIGVLYQLYHLTLRPGRVRVRFADLGPDPVILGHIMKTAGNGILQFLINTTSWVGLFKILATFGSPALAGYTIAIRVILFALMPAWGLANAGATLVGQNLGAGRPDRAEAAIRVALRCNVAMLSVAGVVFIVCSRLLIGVFTSEPAVFSEGVRALWIVSLAFPLYAAGMCLGAAFNGSGDTWTPTWLNFFSFWVCQIPLAWILAVPLHLGSTGVYISVPVSFTLLAVWTGVLFRRGKWKRQRI